MPRPSLVQKVRSVFSNKSKVKRIFRPNLLKCSRIVVIVLGCVWKACVWHADKVASPSNLSLIEQGVYVAGTIRFQVEYVLTLVKLVTFILPRLNTHSDELKNFFSELKSSLDNN